MGLFSKKTDEEKEFDARLKEICGGFVPNDFFVKKALDHNLSRTTTSVNYKNVLKSEFKNGSLETEDIEKRLDELLDLDIDTLFLKIVRNDIDSSRFHTQKEITEFMGGKYKEKYYKKLKMDQSTNINQKKVNSSNLDLNNDNDNVQSTYEKENQISSNYTSQDNEKTEEKNNLSPEELKKFESDTKLLLRRLCGESTNYGFKKRLEKHDLPKDTLNTDYKSILEYEIKNYDLKLEDVELRLEELLDLDVETLCSEFLIEDKDTTPFKSQKDLNSYFGKEYAKDYKTKRKDYKKKAKDLINKEKKDEEERKRKTEERLKNQEINKQSSSSALNKSSESNMANGNNNRNNNVCLYNFNCKTLEDSIPLPGGTDFKIVNASVSVFGDRIEIKKTGSFLGIDYGDDVVYFENVASIHFDKVLLIGALDSINITTTGNDVISLVKTTQHMFNRVKECWMDYKSRKQQSNNPINVINNDSNADEIKKYYELFKEGIITEEEFNKKKKDLL